MLDGVEYFVCDYTNEQEMQKDIKSNIKRIFGENSYYIPLKNKNLRRNGEDPRFLC